MATKIARLAYKADNFGPKVPHIAVEMADGTYGVWVALFDRAGRATGSARPVATGWGMSEEEAVGGAKRANARVTRPGEHGGW